MRAVIVERASNPQFVSNTYLVADGEGGPAFFVDAGGPVAPLIETADRRGLRPTHVLLTHHHFDHVCEVQALRERWPGLEVLISPLERDLLRRQRRPERRRTGRPRRRWRPASSRRARRCRSASSRSVRCTRPGTPPGCSRSCVARGHGRRARTRADAAGGGVHRRHAVQGLGRRRARPGPHHLRRPARLDHGHADGAARRRR